MNTYHSRNTRLNITDKEEIISIIEMSKYATLAMISPEGEPYAVAMSHGYDRDLNCLYFHTGHNGKKIDCMKSNPRVCAFILNDQGYVAGKCHHKYQSVVCYGTIKVLTDIEEKRKALTKIFYCLESSKDDAKHLLEMRRVSSINLDNINMLQMDIDGFSGKSK